MANPGSSMPSSRPIPARATEFTSPDRIAKLSTGPWSRAPVAAASVPSHLTSGTIGWRIVLSLTCGSSKDRACSQTLAEEAGLTRPLMQERGSVGPVDGGGAEQVVP